MSEGIGAKIHGIQDVREALAGIAPKLRVRALRNALAAGARLVQRAARSATPVLNLTKRSSAYAYRKGWRVPGTAKKAISVRTSKVAKRAGNVGVFVNVRPAKGGNRGAKNYRDPFYWRWLNFGWTPASGRSKGHKAARVQLNRRGGNRKHVPGAKFIEAGVAMLGAALQEFNRKIEPAIAKLNRPKAPAP